jgi:cellulose synthase/poly-beta-1,6-N-acetylglucosamine synthase-like glycosyltransferase
VVIPALQAAATLGSCLQAVLAQDIDTEFDITVAVGPSNDDTRSIADAAAKTHPNVRVVDNPSGATPAALNLAIAASAGPIIARVDAQSVLPAGYLRRAAATLERTGAANVGGIQRPVGGHGRQAIIAAAMASAFGPGPARFRRDGEEGPVDTVYLGVFRRSALEAVGGFDESMRRNQDYDLNWRLRAAGHQVWFDPELVVDYRPRPTLGRLWDQHWQYGAWKRYSLIRAPKSLRIRQLVAPALVVGLAFSLGALIAGSLLGLVIPVIYLLAAILASTRCEVTGFSNRLILLAAFATIHLGWGSGFLVGRRGG